MAINGSFTYNFNQSNIHEQMFNSGPQAAPQEVPEVPKTQQKSGFIGIEKLKVCANNSIANSMFGRVADGRKFAFYLDKEIHALGIRPKICTITLNTKKNGFQIDGQKL